MSHSRCITLWIIYLLSALATDVLSAENMVLKRYCLTGTVRDSASLKPLAFAEIKMFSRREGGLPDAVIQYTMSDSNGHFTVCVNEIVGSLVMNAVSYRQKIIQLTEMKDSVTVLDDVLMGVDALMIKGGGLKVKKEIEKIEIDKKTYAVSNSVLSTGGTAIDALRQIPAVNVDADGNISLRGSNNVTIYINGKQSSLSGSDRLAMLMQIPAANIESIDVNTNPGAKQDAEGMSGIINIVLKKNTTKGKSGYVSAGAGNRNKYNGTANFNYNNTKWNFSNTLSFRQNDLWGKGYNERNNFTQDTSFFINQYSKSQSLSRNLTLSGNVDYNAIKNLVLSVNYLVSNNSDKEDETNRILLGDERDSLSQMIRRQTFQKGNTLNTDMGGTVRKTFDKPAHNLLFLVNYSGTARDNSTDIVQNELNTLTEEVKPYNPYLLFNKNKNRFSNTLVQMDYTKPIQANKKLETGLKFTGRNLDNYFMIDSFNHNLQQHITDSGKSNHFIYSENVSAVYGMLTHTFSELIKYNIGLRIENTSIFGAEIISQEDFVINYTNLFPSGSINFTLQKKYKLPDIQMSYSRRINRPGQWQLNPFVSISDPYNLSKGNPKLRAELTDAFELSAFYNTKPILLTATVYYRQTNSPISRYRLIDSAGISTTSFYNLDYNRSTGAELVARLNLNKDLKLTLNGNLYKYVITGNVEGNDFVTQRVMYSGKAILNYTFLKKTELQSSFSYMGPMQTPQGTMRSMYGLELGVKKDIIKEKLSFSLTLTDVMNNRRFNMLMSDVNFNGSFYRKRESRILTFNLTWKFGKSTQAEKKPKMQEAPVNMDF